MKIEIVQLESEWNQTSLGCYVSMNNTLIDVLTPVNNLHELNTVEISNSGTLRLVIRDMGKSDGYLGSVSFPVLILNSNTSPLTVPLFSSVNGDGIESVPVNCGMPRLTIGFLNDFGDDEIFLSSCEVKVEDRGEIRMDSKYSICEENLSPNFGDWKKNDGLEILQSELEIANNELEREKEKNRVLEKKYFNLIQKIKENCSRAQTRENSLLDLLLEKEEKINKSLQINMQLQNSIRNMAFDHKITLGQVEKYEKQEEYVKQLETELKKYQEMLATAEKTKDELTNTLIELTQTDNFDHSFRQIVTTKVLTERNSSEKPQSWADDVFLSYIKKNLPKQVSRKVCKIRDFVYKINDICTSLVICEEGVYCKSGKELVSLAEYLEKPLIKPTALTPDSGSKTLKNFQKLTKSSLNRLRSSEPCSLSRALKSTPSKPRKYA